MNDHDVCAIGNALLDIDIEISPATLQRLNVEKGVMTLIDAERERVLLEELDGIKHVKACGGSAANTAVLVSQLGAKVFYSCKVAKDDAGDFYYQDLVSHGVKTNITADNRISGITGKCLAMITPDADRTMNTFLGITEQFSVDELDHQAIANSKYLYIEGYLVASPSAQIAAITAAKIARQNNTKIALTLSDPNMVKFFKDNLLTIIGDGIDLLFCNEEEAKIFTGQEDLNQVSEILKSYASHFVITLSNRGSLIFDGQHSHHVAAYTTSALDTTGAGDVFAGAYLYGLINDFNPKIAGDIASLAAAKIVTKFGPRLNTEEVKNIKQHVNKYLTTA